MGFIKFIPLGDAAYSDLETTNTPVLQLWQELVSLRHLAHPAGITAKKASAPWVDQAKIYFLDACKSNWQTSGLLYYYSFLNLTKAYLAAKSVIPAKDLKTTSVYHGLTSDPQALAGVIDFEIKVHPPQHNNRKNLFSTFYQKLTGHAWPHSTIITVKAGEFLPYCREITSEIESFYSLSTSIVTAQSLVRDGENKLWFEVRIPTPSATAVQSHIPEENTTVVKYDSMNDEDCNDWLTAYDVTRQLLDQSIFIRTRQLPYQTANRDSIVGQVMTTANNYFARYALLHPTPRIPPFMSWQFIPKITLAGATLDWHPLLSDYLFAFMLSTILRYYPHLVPRESQEAFMFEAWCNQSAISALRYFLMSFTSPSIRIARG